MNNENIKTLMREMNKVASSIATDLPVVSTHFTSDKATDKNNFNVECKAAVKMIRKASAHLVNALQIANETKEPEEESCTDTELTL